VLALRFSARLGIQVLWIVFIALMVVSPVPVMLFPIIPRTRRGNVPSEVLRKK
jgi:hypothetical protein